MISIKDGWRETRLAHVVIGFRLASWRQAAHGSGDVRRQGASKIDLSQNSALHKGLEED
jgi:hypothetical protein